MCVKIHAIMFKFPLNTLIDSKSKSLSYLYNPLKQILICKKNHEFHT